MEELSLRLERYSATFAASFTCSGSLRTTCACQDCQAPVGCVVGAGFELQFCALYEEWKVVAARTAGDLRIVRNTLARWGKRFRTSRYNHDILHSSPHPSHLFEPPSSTANHCPDSHQMLIDEATMPLQDPFRLPNSSLDLPLTNELNATFFVAFISSISPETRQPWCPDVRAALPLVDAAFSAKSAPKVGYVHVGQKPEYVNTTSAYFHCAIANLD